MIVRVISDVVIFQLRRYPTDILDTLFLVQISIFSQISLKIALFARISLSAELYYSYVEK